MASPTIVSFDENMRNPDGLRPAGKQWRVLVADDHEPVLEELRQLLPSEFEIVGSVINGEDLVGAAVKLRPDVVICDLSMPILDGLAAGRQIVKQGLCDAVVILSMHSEPDMVGCALGVGIRGYVLKMDAGDELVPALTSVLAGRIYLSRGVAARS